MKGIQSILGLLAVYVVLNGVLYCGQGFLKRDEVERAQSIERDLHRLEREIGQLEAWLNARGQESEAIDRLGIRLDHPDRNYGTRVAYERDLALYNRQVDDWNAGIPEVQRASTRYDSLVAGFNALVVEHNQVGRSAYSRFWLIPIPAPRRAAQVVRTTG